jgi:hypothetical protein
MYRISTSSVLSFEGLSRHLSFLDIVTRAAQRTEACLHPRSLPANVAQQCRVLRSSTSGVNLSFSMSISLATSLLGYIHYPKARHRQSCTFLGSCTRHEPHLRSVPETGCRHRRGEPRPLAKLAPKSSCACSKVGTELTGTQKSRGRFAEDGSIPAPESPCAYRFKPSRTRNSRATSTPVPKRLARREH